MSICYRYETGHQLDKVQQLHHIYRSIYNPAGGSQVIVLPDSIGCGKMKGAVYNKDIRMIDYQANFNAGLELKGTCDEPHIDMIFCLGETVQWNIEGLQSRFMMKEGQSMIALNKATSKQYELPHNRNMHMMELKIPEKVFGEFYGDTMVRKLEESPNLMCKLTPKIRQLIFELRNNTYGSCLQQVYGEAKLMELMTVFLAEIIGKHGQQVESLSVDDRERILSVKQIIDEQYANTPTIKELSRAVGLNECKLKKAYKEVFHVSIRQQVIQRKMEKAYELFQQGNMSVSHVANEVGYINVSHFASAFKKIYGINPSKCSCLG